MRRPLVADPSRARAVFGWVPEYSSLETIVSTSWQWNVSV